MDNDIKKKDDRGVSLVELIIVIAIMGIFIGVTGYGLGMVSRKPVDECAKKIEMILNQNRTSAMGSTEAWVEFYVNAEERVAVRTHLLNNTRGAAPAKETDSVIGADGVNIRFFLDSGEEDLSAGEKRIGFRRDSGSLTGDEHGKIYTKIVIYKGSYTRTIELDKLTGKVKLN